jgi:hypothetical protein
LLDVHRKHIPIRGESLAGFGGAVAMELEKPGNVGWGRDSSRLRSRTL